LAKPIFFVFENYGKDYVNFLARLQIIIFVYLIRIIINFICSILYIFILTYINNRQHLATNDLT